MVEVLTPSHQPTVLDGITSTQSQRHPAAQKVIDAHMKWASTQEGMNEGLTADPDANDIVRHLEKMRKSNESADSTTRSDQSSDFTTDVQPAKAKEGEYRTGIAPGVESAEKDEATGILQDRNDTLQHPKHAVTALQDLDTSADLTDDVASTGMLERLKRALAAKEDENVQLRSVVKSMSAMFDAKSQEMEERTKSKMDGLQKRLDEVLKGRSNNEGAGVLPQGDTLKEKDMEVTIEKTTQPTLDTESALSKTMDTHLRNAVGRPLEHDSLSTLASLPALAFSCLDFPFGLSPRFLRSDIFAPDPYNLLNFSMLPRRSRGFPMRAMRVPTVFDSDDRRGLLSQASILDSHFDSATIQAMNTADEKLVSYLSQIEHTPKLVSHKTDSVGEGLGQVVGSREVTDTGDHYKRIYTLTGDAGSQGPITYETLIGPSLYKTSVTVG